MPCPSAPETTHAKGMLLRMPQGAHPHDTQGHWEMMYKGVLTRMLLKCTER